MNAVHTLPFKKITDVHTKVTVLYNHRLCVNGVHTLFYTYVSYLRRFLLKVCIFITKKELYFNRVTNGKSVKVILLFVYSKYTCMLIYFKKIKMLRFFSFFRCVGQCVFKCLTLHEEIIPSKFFVGNS